MRKQKLSDRASAKAAFNRLDRLLSEAEDVIGVSLSSVSFRETYPQAYHAASKAFDHIEKARRELLYRR